MIIPPASTPSFYTMLFTAKSGVEVLKLLVPDPNNDIESVLITSTDMLSDVQAILECQHAIKAFSDKVAAPDQVDCKTDFNPIYLPNCNDLYEQVEFDGDGDLISVAGFGNPFVNVQFKCSAPEQPDFIDANVCYKRFELPPANELLKSEKVLLS